MLPLVPFFILAQIPINPPADITPIPINPTPRRSPAPTPSPTPTPQPVPTPTPPPLPPPERLTPLEQIPKLQSLPQFESLQPTEIRPLPGELDKVPVFNSNSPELVKTEGILLSTFPQQGMRSPQAHLNYPLEGRFDIFSHHISRARTRAEIRSFFQGILIHNPTDKPITLKVLEGASYLTRPDAIYVKLPPMVDNPLGTVFSGPGSRVTSDVLRRRRQGNWPDTMVIAPGEVKQLMNLPMPAGTVLPTSNGRSTLLRVHTDGPVHVANLAMLSPKNPDGTERVPTLDEWKRLLVNGTLSGPRDRRPTPLDRKSVRVPAQIIYGRVAGVSQGSQWEATLTDTPQSENLTIAPPGRAIAYGLSLLHRGRLGTGQIQSAPMLVRYPDTAYYAHGNYGVEYNLTLPLHNNTDKTQKVTVALQTPLKDDATQGLLMFLEPPEDRIFFRGTVRVRHQTTGGASTERYVHLVQQRGQQGETLLELTMKPGDRQQVQVDLIYPPDATPPQVLTVETQSSR